MENKKRFWKVIKDGKIIDVLDSLVYLKWEPKHKTMILSSEDEAQAILSSDKNTVWHEKTLYRIPMEAGVYDTVMLAEIDEHEYKQLKMLNLSTPEQIIDSFVLSLLEDNII